jgi:DNA polymerase III subunit alpha
VFWRGPPPSDLAAHPGTLLALARHAAAVDRRVDKQGQPWAIIALEDLDASIEVVFFATIYTELRQAFAVDTAVTITGRVNRRDEAVSVVGSELIPLDLRDTEGCPGPPPALVLGVDPARFDHNAARTLRTVLTDHRGIVPVWVLVGDTEMAVPVPGDPQPAPREGSQCLPRRRHDRTALHR